MRSQVVFGNIIFNLGHVVLFLHVHSGWPPHIFVFLFNISSSGICSRSLTSSHRKKAFCLQGSSSQKGTFFPGNVQIFCFSQIHKNTEQSRILQYSHFTRQEMTRNFPGHYQLVWSGLGLASALRALHPYIDPACYGRYNMIPPRVKISACVVIVASVRVTEKVVYTAVRIAEVYSQGIGALAGITQSGLHRQDDKPFKTFTQGKCRGTFSFSLLCLLPCFLPCYSLRFLSPPAVLCQYLLLFRVSLRLQLLAVPLGQVCFPFRRASVSLRRLYSVKFIIRFCCRCVLIFRLVRVVVCLSPVRWHFSCFTYTIYLGFFRFEFYLSHSL